MCNIQSPNTRVLIIEVLENGKISLSPVVHLPEHTLTIDELIRCRHYLDLIIDNPNNFHIVSLEPLNISDSIILKIQDRIIPQCKSCNIHLYQYTSTQTERDNEMCIICQKELLIKKIKYDSRGWLWGLCLGRFKNKKIA